MIDKFTKELKFANTVLAAIGGMGLIFLKHLFPRYKEVFDFDMFILFLSPLIVFRIVFEYVEVFLMNKNRTENF